MFITLPMFQKQPLLSRKGSRAIIFVLLLLMVLAIVSLGVLRWPGELPPGTIPSGLRSYLPDEHKCDHTIGLRVSKANGTENYAAVQPGEVVCILAGTRASLELSNFHGTEDAPILFINSDGVVLIDEEDTEYAGIHFINSEHVRLSGLGVAHECGATYTVAEQSCGFVIHGSQRGIVGSDRTGYIEIDHVEVSPSTHSGIFIRTSATDEANRDNWTQYNTYLHHNYVHHAGKEGFYIGGSSYEDGEDPVLVGVEVSYNLIIETGWDGLQVGSAVADCTVHHNRIARDSQARESNQRSGIMNNPGSVCHIYNNFIIESSSRGIYIQGNGGNQVFNNLIIRPGQRVTDEGDGIVVSEGSNRGQSIFVWNNTIIEPARDGIVFRNEQGDENEIYNNLIVKLPNLLGATNVAIETNGLTNVTLANNLSLDSLDEAKFINPDDDNYSLLPDSPAIDAGLDLTDMGLTLDYASTTRPQGSAVDIGAFEYTP